MQNYLEKIELSKDLVMTIFIVSFIGLFAIANYFFGFSLPLYFITITIGFVIAIKYPHAGLYSIVFLTFIFERFFTLVPIVLGRGEYKLYPIDVLLGAVVLGTIAQLINGKLKLQLRRVDYLLIIFAIFSGLYFLVSAFILKTDLSLAFSSAKNYGFYSLFYFVTYLLIDNKDRFKELLAVVFASAIGILWFVVYGIAMRNGLWSEYTPLSTDGVRTLAFTHGYYLCMAFIVSLVYIAYQSDLFSKWLLVFMPLWAIGIVGSMMRHLWIAIFLVIILLIAAFAATARKRLRQHAKNYTVIALMFFVVIFHGVALFPRSKTYESMENSLGAVSSRITSIANTSNDESIVWRTAMWQESAKLYLQDPLFGIGFGKKISIEIGKYHDFVEVRNTHNSFLVVLVQMGFLGLGLLVAIVTMLGWKVYRKKFDDEFMQMGAYIALGILIFHLTAFMFQPYLEANMLGIFFWINLGVLRRLQE